MEKQPLLQGNEGSKLAQVSRSLFRGRAKSQTRINTDLCLWTPEGNCTWKAISGHRVVLGPTHLLRLSEREAQALRLVALAKVRTLGLSCKVELPREETSAPSKPKRRPLLLRKKAKSTSFFEGKDKKGRCAENTSESGGLVFGIPIAQCLLNERMRASGDIPVRDPELSPRIPHLVSSCFQHIEQYGLHTVGIFRVSSSKRKVRQMREDIDSGQNVVLNEEFHPHEVGQLLKEYFRDLPEPLLTRDLYSPLLATLRLPPALQIEALRLLICLLPLQNRDTLWALLSFLEKVARHSTDKMTLGGTTVAGNRMDTGNLATMFGPNILHNAPAASRFNVDSLSRAQDRSDVILVVTTLLESYQQLFQIPAEDMDSVYRRLQVEDADFLNGLLRQRFYQTLEKRGEISTERGRPREAKLNIPLIAISSASLDEALPSDDEDNEKDLSQFDLLTIQDSQASPRRKSFPEKVGESKESSPTQKPNNLEKRRASFTELLAKALSKPESESTKKHDPRRSPRPYSAQRHQTTDFSAGPRKPETPPRPRERGIEKSATTNLVYPCKPERKPRPTGDPQRRQPLRRGDLIASEYVIKSRQ